MTEYVTEERAREREREAFLKAEAYIGVELGTQPTDEFMSGINLAMQRVRELRQDYALKELADLGQEWEKG